MAIGAQVTLPDATQLHYVGIANDSRCPPKVQCIRAGDADVLFDLVRDGASTRITLNTERTLAAPAGAWTLHLVALAQGAAPRVTLRIDPR